MTRRFAAQVAAFIVAAGATVGVGLALHHDKTARQGPVATWLILGNHVTLPQPEWELLLGGIALLAGVVAAALIPYIILAPAHWIREQIRGAEASDLIALVVGVIVGLVIAALASIPLQHLTILDLGSWGPTLAALLIVYVCAATAVLRKDDFMRLVSTSLANRAARRASREEREREEREEREREEPEEHEERSRLRLGGRKSNRHADKVLVDTSAIIDGRIADICDTGFITGTLVVPRFVLEELQHIADSADSLRRNRGRRGLEILQRLQKDSQTAVEISDADAENTPEVDAKLVRLARQWHCPIITNDFNLNRVAELQGVKVLNINELAHAVKPILLPGEDMSVTIMQEGKEAGQGVGYLDDGTMIVVEGGKSFMGDAVDVTVTRVLQTVAGRMIFAHPKQAAGNLPARRTGTA